MRAYALDILPLIKFLLELINVNNMNANEVVFANDFSVAGNLNSIKDYWRKLTAIGPKYNYFPKTTKSYLIVKGKNWWEHKTYFLFQEWNHSWRKPHLGVFCIVNTEYRDEYVKNLVKDWDNQRTMLSTIAETNCKLNYFLKTIPNIRHLLLPLERTIRNKLILAVKGCHICNDKERVLISLPIRYGGLAIHIFHKRAEIEFMSSSKITSKLTVYEGNLKKLNPLLPNVVKWSDTL